MNEEDLFTMLCIKYKKMLNMKESIDKIFNINFIDSNDYYIKNLILGNAIKEKKRIEEIDLYKEYFENKM